VSWSYGFTRRAQHELDDVNQADRRLVYEALDRFAADPFSRHADVTRISGSQGDFRLRVGNWRLMFQYDRTARLILVTRVLRRNEGTYRRR